MFATFKLSSVTQTNNLTPTQLVITKLVMFVPGLFLYILVLWYYYGLDLPKSDILEHWKAYRSYLYMFFSTAFIILGLSRTISRVFKKEHQLMIQQLIPAMIFSLFLMTFSYAIANYTIQLISSDTLLFTTTS